MTSKLGFTNEERSFVAQVAATTGDRLARLGFYAAALVPAAGFGAYGLVYADFLALALAFVGVFFFSIWLVAREFKYALVFSSIFVKIDAVERANDS